MSKEEMATKAAEEMCKLPFEDLEFVCKFIEKLAKKKGGT